jgi:hypothetical protein
MTTRKWIGLSLIGVLLLAVTTPFVVLRYRIAKSAAFCDAVQALPPAQLEQFASQCDRLMLERARGERPQFIADTNILAQFALAGRTPYEIVVQEGVVGIKYFQGNWRYSTLAVWDEESSNKNGEPIKVLKITYGTYGWRVLVQRQNPIDGNLKRGG